MCETKDSKWILDSGATDTMTFDLSDLNTFSESRQSNIHTANGELAPIYGAGSVAITSSLKVNNCLYVPSLSHKLLSISHVTKELNCIVLMHPHFCLLQDISSGEIIGRGTERRGLYYVDEIAQQGSVMLAHGTANREAWLWHRRLGHPSPGYMKLLFPKMVTPQHLFCETCILAKSHRQSFKLSGTRANSLFSLVHSDVWGPAPNLGGQNLKYFLLFVDDCTRMTWVYFLKHKYEVCEKNFHFYTMIQTQFQTSIKILRSDNGGEFVNTTMKQFFLEKGLIHQTTCPNTPEQNGVAERKNRILLEMTRALLIESRTPKHFWPEALATSVYLLNRLPTKILQLKTPLQALARYTRIPSTLSLQPRIFGCSVFVHIPKQDRSKLSPCAIKCVFVGYGVQQKGYRCYDPKTKQIHTTMNCDFVEGEYFYHLSGQGESSDTDPLSWLPMPMPSPTPEADPTETVNRSTEQIFDANVQLPYLCDHVSISPSRLISEVRSFDTMLNMDREAENCKEHDVKC